MLSQQLQDRLSEEAFARRQIYIWGEIDGRLAEEVVQQISFLADYSTEPIFLLINSQGGDMDAEMAIINEMMAAQQEKIQVCTLACGVAYSAAAGILAMGTKKWRGARPDSAIMLHPASLSLEHDYESNQRALMGFLSKRCEMINRMTATACGMIKKYKKFLSDIDKGLWLSAEEAVKYGVIDTVWCGPLPYVREIENEKTSDK